MKKNKRSIDGFVPKRPINKSKSLGQSNGQRPELGKVNETDVLDGGLKTEYFNDDVSSRLDISQSLDAIDSDDNQKKNKTNFNKKRQDKKEHRRSKTHKARRRVIWISIIAIIVAILSVAGYLAYKVINQSGDVFQGSLISLIKNQPLKEDENGRSNFLVFGTSEDDPGHDGANLTDSIMIISIGQTSKDAVMFSIPRDLEVEYGRACLPGYRGKINAYYSCINDEDTAEAEQERLEAMKELIGGVVGMEIQYAIHVNYTVLKEVVDAVGGIDIVIESDDPRGYLDSQLDYLCGDTYSERITNCPPNGHYVEYPNGPVTLDGQQALNLARARGDSAPTYGFTSSNFEREKNQRKIIIAIRDKALNSGVLTNLRSVSNLIDALGDNLRTDIQTDEIRTLLQLASEIDNSNIVSLNLLEDKVFSSSGNPSAGLYEFSQLQSYLEEKLSNNPIVRENASIIVFNGTDTVGLGQEKADDLISQDFNVTDVGNAPDGQYDAVEIYKVSDGNEYTGEALGDYYNVEVRNDSPPVSYYGETDFVIIFGDAS